MFNNLNNPNKPDHQAVDDIFAETDKAPAGSAAPESPNSEIETRRVGVDASDNTAPESSEKSGDNKWFKIIIIIIVLAILALAGYLVYSKFFQAGSGLNTNITPSTANTGEKSAATTPTGSFVTPTGGNSTVTPETAGANTPAATNSESVASSSAASLVDSDNDGLTDAEEKILGTNPNSADTDNDGLSDYAEVKIYHTNPLVADTDGDGYLDGAEVKAGYNPNGAGKLPGIATTSAATSSVTTK